MTTGVTSISHGILTSYVAPYLPRPKKKKEKKKEKMNIQQRFHLKFLMKTFSFEIY